MQEEERKKGGQGQLVVFVVSFIVSNLLNIPLGEKEKKRQKQNREQERNGDQGLKA